MRKKNDYRTIDEKIYDFMYKNRKKIMLYSFVIALTMVVISIFTSNKEGLNAIVFYPLAFLGFIFDLRFDAGGYKYIRFSFSITLFFLSLLAFLLGFFIEI